MYPSYETWLTAVLELPPGETPFPWQRQLLERFLAGDMPDVLDMPTGLGKTSVMAIWLIARALGAPVPRRLVYVVDRRAVVDQATDTAEALRRWVDQTPTVKAALGITGSLAISTLRGQFLDNREWLADPAAPAIIVGTVDMIGSRLLFQGYGVSRKMRPYHAGLLGVDALIALDEAHLVPAFAHLIQTLATDAALRPTTPWPLPPFRVMTLTATPTQTAATRLTLTEADYYHPVAVQRLRAIKSLQWLDSVPEKDLAETMAGHAWDLAANGAHPARVIVYAHSRNVVDSVLTVVKRLARMAGHGVATELLVGARRVHERVQAQARLATLGFVAGSAPPPVPTILGATAAGEVGVDLDADHLVCDVVAWERLVQRLGRVNRRGTGVARVRVIPTQTDKPTPIPEAVHAVLQHLPCTADGWDVSPAALRQLTVKATTDGALNALLTAATTPEPLRPPLDPAVVEDWAMTSLPDHPGRASLQPWLRGWNPADPPQTIVLWRMYLPVPLEGPTGDPTDLMDFFEAAPPHLSEQLACAYYEALKWLKFCAQRLLRETAGEVAPNTVIAWLLDATGTFHALTLAEAAAVTRESAPWADAMLIVDARLGGLSPDGLLDAHRATVPETADSGGWRETDGVAFRVQVTDDLDDRPRDTGWRERFRLPISWTAEGEAKRWWVVEKWRDDAATEDDRAVTHPQLLDAHQAQVADRARGLAVTLGVPPEFKAALVQAALWHDEGKRADRWQRAFQAPVDGVYAKTAGPVHAAWLQGYRHEFGSVIRVMADARLEALEPDARALTLHLIAAHHGGARPLLAATGCDIAPPSVLERPVATVALRFAQLQAQWGPWGLAWWEALLRAADQQASRDNDRADVSTGGA